MYNQHAFEIFRLILEYHVGSEKRLDNFVSCSISGSEMIKIACFRPRRTGNAFKTFDIDA